MVFTWFKTISSLLIELFRQVNFLSNCDTALSKLFCGRVICLTSIVAWRDSYPVQALLNKLLREFIHGRKLSDREDMLENAFHSHISNDVHIQRVLVL